MRRVLCLPALLLLLFAFDAHAESTGDEAPPEDGNSTWLELGAGTTLPISVGAELAIEAPFGLRACLGAGLLPGAYVDLINAILVSAEAYDENTARVIEGSLGNAFVLDLRLGWRPSREWGFFAQLGYTLVTLGGGFQNEDLLSLATGQNVPSSPSAAEKNYDAQSSLHLLALDLGWTWELYQGLILSASLGFRATLDASTQIEPDFRPLAPALVDAFTSYTEAYLDDTFESYVFLPTLGITLSYRFAL